MVLGVERSTSAHAAHKQTAPTGIGLEAGLAHLARAGGIDGLAGDAIEADPGKCGDQFLDKRRVDDILLEYPSIAVADDGSVRADRLDGIRLEAAIATPGIGATRRCRHMGASPHRRTDSAQDGVIRDVKQVEQRSIEVAREQLDHGGGSLRAGAPA